MQKYILTFGLIGGVIMFFLVFLVTTLHDKEMISQESGTGLLIGYGTMIVSLSVIFFGIKSYRDKHAGGTITFWKGIQIGLLISVIGCVMYFVGLEAYCLVNPDFAPRFMQRWADNAADKARSRGASEDEIANERKQVDEMYKFMANPPFLLLICFIEMFPVGVVITILSAALLRKRELLPAAAA